jgi:hypothetical protein
MNSKLSSYNQNSSSSNSIQLNQVNLEANFRLNHHHHNNNNNSTTNSSFNSRNKSAITLLNDNSSYGNQQVLHHHTSPTLNINNINLNAYNNNSFSYSSNNNNNGIKMQNLIAKNFIDFNVLSTHTTNSPSNLIQVPQLYQLTNRNYRQNAPLINSANNKIESTGKLFEDILSSSRRNSVSNSNNNNDNQKQSLPASCTVINRTIEERAQHPDKLIVER